MSQAVWVSAIVMFIQDVWSLLMQQRGRLCGWYMVIAWEYDVW